MLTAARIALLLLVAAVLPPAAAAGQTRALLVGVSKYASLDASLQLRGPVNDVTLYRDLLRARGVPAANVRVLADGAPGAIRPTRAAVLQGLNDLARVSRTGDFVFILVSGHGSQQPAGIDSGNEPDGRDEIFLPADIGRWDGEVGQVRNAITDNEFGAAIDRIRARGAFVWAVFDTCHAGTMTRALPAASERDRSVSPQALGVDEAAFEKSLEASSSRTRVDAVTTQPKGDFVFMYASQSYESTSELDLPENTRGAKPYGQFSFTLYQVLAREPQVSYRQAIERVMQIYLSRGRQNPSPLYEGSKLDAAVFGDTESAVVVQWPLEHVGRVLQVSAGEIHGVTKGSILAVVATPTSAADAVSGYVQVVDSTATTATVEPIAYEKRTAPQIERIARVYARPVDLKVDFRLRVGLPQSGGFCHSPRELVTRAIDTLRENAKYSSRLIWVDARQSADVYLCQKGDNLLFLDPAREVRNGSGKSVPGVAVRGTSSPAEVTAFAATLESQLMRVSRVVNLARVVAGNSSIAGDLQVKVDLQRQCTANDRTCDARPHMIDAISREILRDGDTVSINLANAGDRPIDVTILYIDAADGIGHLYPKTAEDVPRFEPHSSYRFEFPVNASPSGFERMLILAAPAAPQAPIVSFASLAQESMPIAREAQHLFPGEALGEGSIRELLEEAAFGSSQFSTTRGTSPRGVEGSALSAMIYAWTVLPREP